MNNARRCMIKKAIENLWDAIEIISVVLNEEQGAFDNLPEGLQYSERGEQMEENISNLEECLSGIEDYIDTLDDM